MNQHLHVLLTIHSAIKNHRQDIHIEHSKNRSSGVFTTKQTVKDVEKYFSESPEKENKSKFVLSLK